MNGNAPATRAARVLGVVVTFHPGDGVRDHLRALVSQLERVVVVDNTPGAAPAALDAAGLPPGVSVRRLGDNLGIARALNEGVEEAVQGGFDWLLAFDQDTPVPERYVARLLARAGEDPGVGMVVPRLETDPAPAPTGEVRRAITSGSLTRVAAFARAGRYREELFIDGVDFDLCIRLRRAGYRILQAGDVVLRHQVGTPRVARIAGLRVVTSNHAPYRRYYKIRNRVALVRDYLGEEPAWLAREVLSTGWEALKILLLEEQRGAKLGAMARGALDGIRGRMGPSRR